MHQLNPDVIIGYNIFGFDYEFMFQRARQNGCERQFLELSRIKDQICANIKNERIEIVSNFFKRFLSIELIAIINLL